MVLNTQKSEGKLANSGKFPLRLKGNHIAQHGILKLFGFFFPTLDLHYLDGPKIGLLLKGQLENLQDFHIMETVFQLQC